MRTLYPNLSSIIDYLFSFTQPPTNLESFKENFTTSLAAKDPDFTSVNHTNSAIAKALTFTNVNCTTFENSKIPIRD